MAVTMAQVLNLDTVKSATVIATADGDTTQTLLWVTAGSDFAGVPLCAVITPITAAGGLSAWAVTVMTATTLTIVKATTAGSGAAPVQAVFTVFLAPAFSAGRTARDGRNPFALPI